MATKEMIKILSHKEMKTKITLRFYLTHQNSFLKKTNTGEDVGKKQPLYAVGGNIN
jgi:hypothetical protein